MASRTSRNPARSAARLALAALFAGFVLMPGPEGTLAAFEVAQSPGYDDGQYQDPQDAAPETEQPGQRDGSPSEDGTDEAPDATAPEPPSGCNFRDGRPLELLV